MSRRTILGFSLLVLSAALAACAKGPIAPEGATLPAEDGPGSPAGPDGPGPVATTIAIGPMSISLEPGQSSQFQAEVRDQQGQPMSAPVSWSATGGSIGWTGLYLAGPAQGAFRVTATSGALTASASVTIAAPPAPPPSPPPPPAPVATTLTIAPGSASLEPGQSTRFQAEIRDQYGQPMSAPISWSATGGTIGSTGLYVAGPTPGAYVVTATSGALMASASVTITSPPPPAPVATTLAIAPTSVALEPGGSSQFHADVRDSYGQPMSAPISWTATGGTVGSTGLYVAGTTPGSYRVTATTSGLSASASVTITSPPPALPPPAPSGVRIQPGTSIQAVVDAHPAGTTFILAAGVHTRQSVWPKDGMTFFGEPGTVLEGQGADRAFDGTARDVTIDGLEIRNYATSRIVGAIHGDNSVDWTIRNSHIHHNTGMGIRAGRGMRILANRLHDHGDVSIGSSWKSDILVEGNDIYANSGSAIQEGATATAAGLKFYGTTAITVRNNRVHHNNGSGIWMDTSCDQVVIEGNQVYDNVWFGIFYEASTGGIIRSNVVQRNGLGTPRNTGWPNQAGITVQTSSGVEIHGNTLQGNGDGIALMESGYGPTRLDRIYVHDNEVGGGRTGVVQSTGDTSVFGRDFRFERNRYAATASFLWGGATLTVSQWRARFPLDAL